MSTILECKGLSYSYGKKKALDGVSFTIDSGKIVGLFGPNGSGKTTLIKILAGMIHNENGTVSICGNPVGAKSKAVVSYSPDRMPYRNDQKISAILDAYDTMFEDFDRKEAEKSLEELGIHSDDIIGKLSKGNSEKLQIIIAMSRKAKLYILDEPFNGIDPVARESVVKIMLRMVPEESSLILSTHQIGDIEQILDEAIFIRDGKIVLQKTVDEIRDEKGQSLADAYMEEFR
jgi:ABC-2 type transport system ATP-binding protein